MYQIVCRLGLRHRPHWGSLKRSPRPPSWIKGPTSKGGEGMGGEEREVEGREGNGREWKESAPPGPKSWWRHCTLISLTCKMLYNRSLPGWLQIYWLSTLLKLSFFLSDLNNSFLKYTTLLSLQPTLLATLALSLMNALPSPTKSLHFLNPATITFVNFDVSAFYIDFKTASTIATSIVHSKLDYCNLLYHNLPNY